MASSSGFSPYELLKPSSDILLGSDSALSELYELKHELGEHLAQAGCLVAVDKKTGISYALYERKFADLEPRKCAELVVAIAAQRRIREDPPSDVPDEMRTARVACLREVLLSPTRIFLVDELAPTEGAVCDSLFSLLQRRGRLAEADARRIFTRIVLATKRVHDCGSVLRDLKPEIVQVRQATKNGEFEVCLTHLHCAATLSGPADEAGNLTGLIGTPEYCAPEVAIWFWHECVPPRLPEPPPSYGAKADVWALGMCLHVMLCGCFPFTPSAEEEELLRTINTAAFAFNDPGWRKVSEEALDLVGQLLARDPLDRPFLEEVLQHPFCGEALQEAMLQDEVASPQRGLDAAAFDRALEELDDDDDDDDDERPGQ